MLPGIRQKESASRLSFLGLSVFATAILWRTRWVWAAEASVVVSALFVAFRFVRELGIYKGWETWPSTEASFYSGSIASIGRGGGFIAEVSYSYQVGGSFYGGTDRRQFATAAEAEHFLKVRSESAFVIRYNPSQADYSLLDR